MVRASRAPYGKRNHGPGARPVTARTAAAPSRTSSTTLVDGRVVRSGWVSEWSPTGWAALIDRADAGWSRTKSPGRKNVAAARFAASVARMDATPVLLAPPSKVSTATFDVVGTSVRSWPRYSAISWQAVGAGGVLVL